MNLEIPKWLSDEVAEYDLEMESAPRTVLDIGANIGAFALRAHAKWPGAAILCYEPVKENYFGLAKNVFGCPKIKAYRFALRSFNGPDKILIGAGTPDLRGVTCGFHQLGRQTNVTEKVMCIDAGEIAGAELVKIDTEGCEVEIVSRLDLSKTRALVVEYHRPEDVAVLNGMMVAAGFLLIEERPGNGKHGILKFGKEGVRVPQAKMEDGGSKIEKESAALSGHACCDAATTAERQLRPTDFKDRQDACPTSNRKIYVAIASHFSNHDLIFLQSMMQLILGATVRMSFGWSCDPSVERARNVLTANFLASDCTHLLFIDSDIAFSPRDVQRIISHDEDVVGGIYPLKTMDRDVKWCGNARGMATAPPGAPLDAAPDQVRPDGLQEVGCIGTGFMCIARRAFERMIEADGQKIRYHQDWPPHREEFAFWRQTIRGVNGRKRFLTEDWNFCYRYRELGGKIFADTQVILRHAGRAVWPLDIQLGNPFVKPNNPQSAVPIPQSETRSADCGSSFARAMEDKVRNEKSQGSTESRPTIKEI
jgi:FkbM family methyltransferase